MTGRRVLRWFRRARLSREIDEEIRFHLDMRSVEYQAEGMTALDARRRAAHRFGNVEAVRRAVRRARRVPADGPGRGEIMNGIWQDLRFAFRGFFRQPMFAGLAVVTLALGIGANTAMFGLVDSVILHPLPFADADRLVWVWKERGTGGMMISPGMQEAARWRTASRLEGMVNLSGFEASLALGEDEVMPVRAARVSTDLLGFLGLRPVAGRGFVPSDSAVGSNRVALLAEAFWRARSGRARDVIGSTIELDGERYEVIGIAPASLDRLYRSLPLQVLVPLQTSAEDRGVTTLARLERDATLEGAQAELRGIDASLTPTEETTDWMAHLVRPYEMTSRQLRTGLWVLLGAVGLVLLIACANVANMLLARGVGRQHELAIRTALGAGRFRLARQFVTESLALSVLGAGAGIGLAYLGLDVLRALVPSGLADLGYATVSPLVLLLGVGAGVGSGLVFGLAPAGHAVSAQPGDALRQGTRGGDSRFRSRVRQWLVGFEVALAFVVVVGAALLLQSFVQLSRVDPGFEVERLVAVGVNLPETSYATSAARESFFRQVLARIRELPSVTTATVALGVPPRMGAVLSGVQVEGQPDAVDSRAGVVSANRVQPEYFATLGIPLLAGRAFHPTDVPSQVVIVNERFAHEFWPGEDAVGKRFRWAHDDEWITIVGVVGNVQGHGLADDPERGQVYKLFDRESFPRSVTILARGSGDPDDAIALVRGQVGSIDSALPIRDAASVVAMFAESIARPRFNTMVLTGFAVLALVLAVTGMYGVISLTVNQRLREIGVRLALGARGADVKRLMVTWGMRPVMIGMMVGIVASLAAGRVLASLLFGIPATDPLTYGVVVVLTLSVGIAAAYAPARRAARVDPVEVLRTE